MDPATGSPSSQDATLQTLPAEKLLSYMQAALDLTSIPKEEINRPDSPQLPDSPSERHC